MTVTEKQKKNLIPLKKGYDPRRNMKGVPKDQLAASRLIRRIGAELIHVREKTDTGDTVEYDLTRFEAMIRLMFSSKSSAAQKELIERMAGKVPQPVELSGPDGGPVDINTSNVITIVFDDSADDKKAD